LSGGGWIGWIGWLVVDGNSRKMRVCLRELSVVRAGNVKVRASWL
jgi:hypothetical protein